MKKIFLSPFFNETNEYIDIQKQYLAECGYEVVSLDLRSIFSKKIIEILSPKNCIIIHWLENRAFSENKKNLSLIGLTQYLIYFLIFSLSRAKVIYFIHDHYVHDTTGLMKQVSRLLIRLLRKISDVRVVHDPTAAEPLKAQYVPHPLYEQQPSSTREGTPKFDFGMIGAVRPYKKIDWVVQNWPLHYSLLIAGYGLVDYIKTIENLIANSESTEILTNFKFLSIAELNEAFRNSRCLILAHWENSALVSGAFFNALGKTDYIIARRTPFLTWASNIFENLFLFETREEFVSMVDLVAGKPDVSTEIHARISAAANENFGKEICKIAYVKIIG